MLCIIISDPLWLALKQRFLSSTPTSNIDLASGPPPPPCHCGGTAPAGVGAQCPLVLYCALSELDNVSRKWTRVLIGRVRSWKPTVSWDVYILKPSESFLTIYLNRTICRLLLNLDRSLFNTHISLNLRNNYYIAVIHVVILRYTPLLFLLCRGCDRDFMNWDLCPVRELYV